MANPNIVDVATIKGGNFGWNLSTGLTTTLIEVTGSDVIVKLNRVTCTNVDGSAAADLDLFVSGLGTGAVDGVTATGGDSDVYLAKTISVPADASLVVLDTPIYLKEGDLLKGGASAAGDLDLFISFDVIS